MPRKRNTVKQSLQNENLAFTGQNYIFWENHEERLI